MSGNRVDILLACFNGEPFLAELLDSLFSQHCQDWHLLVRDDGSVDGSLGILDGYQAKFPGRITVVVDGICSGSAKANFSRLLCLSDADYVMFCDQDDVWLPNKVEICLARMRELESDLGLLPLVVHTDLSVVDRDLSVIAPSMMTYQRLNPRPAFDELLVSNSVSGCTMMLNRPAVEVCRPIPDAAIMHDWWIALQVLSVGGQLDYIDQPTLLYRQHGGNVVGSQAFSLKHFVTKLFRWGSLYESLRLIRRQADYFGARFGLPLCLVKLKYGLFRFFR